MLQKLLKIHNYSYTAELPAIKPGRRVALGFWKLEATSSAVAKLGS